MDALTPDGHVDGDDGASGGVDQLDHPRGVLAGRVAQADPEQRVDDHIRLAEVAEAVDDSHLAPALLEQARTDASVTAVVAAAADDGHPAGEAAEHDVRHGRPCAIHQLGQRPGVRGLGNAGLVGREERLEPHASTTTATAAASSREWVIDSSILPAPTFSAHAAVRPERCTPGFGRPRISISFHVK